jgi:hypothetical protein
MSGECNVCGRTGCVEDNHPATPAERLRACPHYTQIHATSEHLADDDHPETCGGCGGDPVHGPSEWCPVYGEVEE